MRGIEEAIGDILVFVDDNVLDADYLEVVLRISKDFPFLGAMCMESRERRFYCAKQRGEHQAAQEILVL